MKLLTIQIEISPEVEDALTIFAQDSLHALGSEAIRRQDFEEAGWRHDSTVVDWDELHDLPVDVRLIFYFDQERDQDELVAAFRAKLAELKGYGLAVGDGSIKTGYIQDEDWNTVWKKYYQPISFSRHLAIVPEWEDYQPAFPDQKLIKMDPGLAFGTGNHETTQLAMLALERVLTKPVKVADVGTGSGILAIAASKLGAKEVLGTDISEDSMDAAKENFALNNITNYQLQKTSLLTGVAGKYDIIVANILAEILLDLIPQLQAHLADQGKVIFSGIDYLQLPKIKHALDENGFQIILQMQEKRWIGLLISRKDQ